MTRSLFLQEADCGLCALAAKKTTPSATSAQGEILYATEGLFLLDGGLRGIVHGLFTGT
jgi:hypothetical protein